MNGINKFLSQANNKSRRGNDIFDNEYELNEQMNCDNNDSCSNCSCKTDSDNNDSIDQSDEI